MLRPFYFVYYIAIAVSLPFFPPYLRALGLSGKEVSLVLSVAPVMHLGVPLFWGWFADRTRRPDLLLRIACLGACLFYSPINFVRTMPTLLLVIAGHQAFAVAINGLADTLAVQRARQGDDYGRIRVWGSVSFSLACLVIAPILSARNRPDGDPLVPLLSTTCLGLAFLASLAVRGQGPTVRPHAKDVRLLLADRRFLFLLVLAPLHWACCAPYHGFLGILIKDRGLPTTTTGHAFFASVTGELLALYFFRNLRRRFSLPTLLAASFAASIARWLLTAYATTPQMLVGLQTLHALTFGLFWVACLAWLSECVPSNLRATGQTLFTACTLGIGNILGTMGTGIIYDIAHSAAPARR